MAERVKEWRKNNSRTGEFHRQDVRVKERIYAILGNKCVVCGFSDSRALCIDHVKGNGREHRAKFTASNGNFRGRKYYKAILAELLLGSKDYQLLCANHNQIKKYENKEGVKYAVCGL